MIAAPALMSSDAACHRVLPVPAAAIPLRRTTRGGARASPSGVRSRAPGRFSGDITQPHLPSDLGFYDLRVAETRIEQAALAREHGLHGFCYYWYWFSGKRLLERPLDRAFWLRDSPTFHFCICWANENWTRRWDGREDEVLARQRYAPEDALAVVRAWLPMFEDRRYLRVAGRPLVLVYCADALPEPARWAEIWREEARRAGHAGLHIAHVLSVNQRTSDPSGAGVRRGRRVSAALDALDAVDGGRARSRERLSRSDSRLRRVCAERARTPGADTRCCEASCPGGTIAPGWGQPQTFS